MTRNGPQTRRVILCSLAAMLSLVVAGQYGHCQQASSAESRFASELRAEVDQLKRWLGFPPSDTLADIQEKVKEDMKRYGAGTLPEHMHTYRGLLERQREVMEEMKKEREHLRNSLQQIESRFADREAGKDKQMEQFRAAVKQQHRGPDGEPANTGRGQASPNTQPARAGHIRRVNKPSGTVLIQFDEAGESAIKARFDVYTPRLPTAERSSKVETARKSTGYIEVTRILGNHYAEARIVEDDQNQPIVPGDELQGAERNSAKARP